MPSPVAKSKPVPTAPVSQPLPQTRTRTYTLELLVAVTVLIAIAILLLITKVELYHAKDQSDFKVISNELQNIESRIQNIGVKQGSAAQASPSAKPLSYYLSTYTQFPSTITTNQVEKMTLAFKIDQSEPCDPKTSELCDPKTLTLPAGINVYSDASWSDGADHAFYFEYGVEGPAKVYGPFMDNVSRLSQEAEKPTAITVNYTEPNAADATSWVKQNPTKVDPPATTSFVTKNWNGLPLVFPTGSLIAQNSDSILISSHDLSKVWLCSGGAIVAPCLAGYGISVSPYSNAQFASGYAFTPSKIYPGLTEIGSTEGAEYTYYYSFSFNGKKYLINIDQAEVSTAGTYQEPLRYDVEGVVSKFLTAISNVATK